MNAKQYRAKKLAKTEHAEETYVEGWNDALDLVSDLLRDMKQPNLAILVRGIGRAEVDPQTGKPIAWDDEPAHERSGAV